MTTLRHGVSGGVLVNAGYFTDAGLILFLIFHTWRGCRCGFLWQVTALAALGFGVGLGMVLAPTMGSRMMGVLTSNPFHAQLTAFLFVFGVVALLFRILATWAEGTTEMGANKKEKEQSRGNDRILGGIFGAFKGLLMVLVFCAASVTLWPKLDAWENSTLIPPFATAGARLLPDGAVHEVQAWAETSATKFGHGMKINIESETAAAKLP